MSDAKKVEPATPTTESKTRRPLSRRRKWLFRLTAMILAPTLFFGGLELSLRAFGYGHSTAFFLDGEEAEGADVWIENPNFGRWVFPRSLLAMPQPVQFVLPKQKEERTFRIFVLGESAAQGFPDQSSSFARVLEVMLAQQYPHIKFEVVNTAMVAINSHVARPIARDCADLSPDLFVVHLGNNEVVGPFGAAGVLGSFSPSRGFIRANLTLKSTRTGQLFDRTIQSIAAGSKPPQAWTGMSMFVNSKLRSDDPRLSQIYSHFHDNLNDICTIATDAKAPVILCTIPVNLKDSAPFGSMHAVDLSASNEAAWNQHYEAGVKLESENEFAKAIENYIAAEKIDATFADLAFRQAQCHSALGHAELARKYFEIALEFDVLRFRSGAKINETIRSVATAHAAKGVTLADAQQSFAESSPGGLSGENLFIEHVHMNFAGNYLLARTVFETIRKSPPEALRRTAGDAAVLTQEECAERLAYTEWNEWKFNGKVFEQLMQGPPFTFQLDHADRNERWRKRLMTLKANLQAGGIQKAAATYDKALQRAKKDWMMHLNFGDLLSEAGQSVDARDQYQRVLSQMKHCFTAQYLIGNLELKLQNPRAAELHYREAIRLDAHCLEAQVGLGEALEGQGKKDEALAILQQQIDAHPNRALAHVALGRYFFRAGRFDESEARLKKALELEPSTPSIYVDLGVNALKQGRDAQAVEHFEAALRIRPEWPELQKQVDDLKKKLSAVKRN